MGKIKISAHAKIRQKERQTTINDIQKILKKGKHKKCPEGNNLFTYNNKSIVLCEKNQTVITTFGKGELVADSKMKNVFPKDLPKKIQEDIEERSNIICFKTAFDKKAKSMGVKPIHKNDQEEGIDITKEYLKKIS